MPPEFAVLLTIFAVVVIFWISLNIIRNPVWGLSLLIFFLPFERIPSFDIGGLTIRLNHLVGGLTLIAWLLVIFAGRRKIQSLPITAILGLFLASLWLSVLQAGDLKRAVMTTIFTYIIVALGLLVPQLLTKREQIKPIVWLLGLTTTISMIFALYQFVGDLSGLPNTLTGLEPGFTKAVFGFPRVQAFAQEPLYFGNILLLPIGLTIALLSLPQKWFPRALLSPFLIAMLVTVALTTSRGALLGVLGLLAALVLILGKKMITPHRLTLLGVGMSIAMIATLIGFSALGPEVRQTFIDRVTIKDIGAGDSTAGRLSSWFQAIDLWKTSPLVGIGPGNFGPAITGFPGAPPPGGFAIVNNEYVELLAETGVLGLSLFMVFIYFLLILSWQAYRACHDDPELQAVVAGATAAVVGMIVQYNFFSTLYITSLWITLGFLMAVQVIALRKGNQ